MQLFRYLIVITTLLSPTVGLARIPIGINIDAVNYYSSAVAFNDLMKTVSTMISYPLRSWDWNSGLMEQIPVDGDGWPLQIPYSVNGVLQDVRFLINSHFGG